jgi:hypothetical protein
MHSLFRTFTRKQPAHRRAIVDHALKAVKDTARAHADLALLHQYGGDVSEFAMAKGSTGPHKVVFGDGSGASDNLLRVQGRVLPPPAILTGQASLAGAAQHSANGLVQVEVARPLPGLGAHMDMRDYASVRPTLVQDGAPAPMAVQPISRLAGGACNSSMAQCDPNCTFVQAYVNHKAALDLPTSTSADASTTQSPPPSRFQTVTATQPDLGAWPTRNRHLLQGVHARCPVLLVTEGSSRELAEIFYAQLAAVARDMGVLLAPPSSVVVVGEPEDVERELAAVWAKAARADGGMLPDLVFAVTPGGRDTIYATVKRLCDSVYGVPSQCVTGRNLGKHTLAPDTRQPQWRYDLLSNLVLKINVKSGGLNFSTHCESVLEEAPTLILGADVDHPNKNIRGVRGKKDAIKVPSHSCVVGSRDLAATRYCGVACQQGVGEEVVPAELMQHAVRRHVIMFRANTGRVPERIVYFRDGIGESAVDAITHQEAVAIRNACRSIHPDYAPPIVVVLCVKRHQLRFWPAGADADAGGVDKDALAAANAQLGDAAAMRTDAGVAQASSAVAASAYPPGTRADRGPAPGTVVDGLVARAHHNEFYLHAHHASQGTARPSLYQVVVNEALLSMAQLQQLAYRLCHHGQRVSKTGALPVPVLHAHAMGARINFRSHRFAADSMRRAALQGEALVTDKDSFPQGADVWRLQTHQDLWEVPYYM